MEVFKVPSNVPQDLQFIQDIIGELPPPAPVQKPSTPPPSTVSHDENIDSSDSDADSEKEVEADILTGIAEDEDDENGPVYVPDSRRPIMRYLTPFLDLPHQNLQIRTVIRLILTLRMEMRFPHPNLMEREICLTLTKTRMPDRL